LEHADFCRKLFDLDFTNIKLQCYHCGEDCREETLKFDDKSFCCQGCKTVYQIINKNDLCEYYELSERPGINQKEIARKDLFAFLEDEQVADKLIHFKNKKETHVTFYLPQMHCSSCIWLLENLNRVDPGFIHSKVDFPKKQIELVFSNDLLTLRKAAEWLAAIGYKPHISLNDIDGEVKKPVNRSRILKLGIAGFCFGNIMMLSFPEYFSIAEASELPQLKQVFAYLNLALALPVFFYSSTEFFSSAWHGIKQRFLNIDAPVVLAIVITFARSVYEILTQTGAGYLDSMSGIVFFMLIGRVFQDKTYQTISFERDYKSYFPVSVTVKTEEGEKETPIYKLRVGDRIIIRNGELVPADAILFYGKARIDYSFVTGESAPVSTTIGEIIYAGGKQTGEIIELEIIKDVSQGYLTGLWNKDTFKNKTEEKHVSFVHALARNFTYILLLLAAATSVYWWFNDPSVILNAVSAMLIIACPCALLLSATFTNGNMLLRTGRAGFYLRNASVFESISKVNHIVFDKTGTITSPGDVNLVWAGKELGQRELSVLHSITRISSHPLSRAIAEQTKGNEVLKIQEFSELPSKGIEATVNNQVWRIGSWQFVNRENTTERYDEIQSTKVYVAHNGSLLGVYLFRNKYREGLSDIIHQLKKEGYAISLISGDNNSEEKTLRNILGEDADLLFNQSPEDKLNYIKQLQESGKKVMMIGDGLNDAGALKQSDAGIAISEHINTFSPACDVIVEGSKFRSLPEFFRYSRSGKKIILASFGVSVIYNIIGLWFAMQGLLSPVVAAIIMPLMSVSIVLLTTGASTLLSGKLRRKD
jgi:P-type Cu+ transporter